MSWANRSRPSPTALQSRLADRRGIVDEIARQRIGVRREIGDGPTRPHPAGHRRVGVESPTRRDGDPAEVDVLCRRQVADGLEDLGTRHSLLIDGTGLVGAEPSSATDHFGLRRHSPGDVVQLGDGGPQSPEPQARCEGTLTVTELVVPYSVALHGEWSRRPR